MKISVSRPEPLKKILYLHISIFPGGPRAEHLRHHGLQPVHRVGEGDEDVPAGDVLLEWPQLEQSMPVARALGLLDDTLITYITGVTGDNCTVISYLIKPQSRGGRGAQDFSAASALHYT